MNEGKKYDTCASERCVCKLIQVQPTTNDVKSEDIIKSKKPENTIAEFLKSQPTPDWVQKINEEKRNRECPSIACYKMNKLKDLSNHDNENTGKSGEPNLKLNSEKNPELLQPQPSKPDQIQSKKRYYSNMLGSCNTCTVQDNKKKICPLKICKENKSKRNLNNNVENVVKQDEPISKSNPEKNNIYDLNNGSSDPEVSEWIKLTKNIIDKMKTAPKDNNEKKTAEIIENCTCVYQDIIVIKTTVNDQPQECDKHKGTKPKDRLQIICSETSNSHGKKVSQDGQVTNRQYTVDKNSESKPKKCFFPQSSSELQTDQIKKCPCNCHSI